PPSRRNSGPGGFTMILEQSPFDLDRAAIARRQRANDSGGISRRGFLQSLGAGLLLVAGVPALAEQRRGQQSPATIDTRIHIGEDGAVTVMTGKVEMGQGARAQLTAAAAEELRLPPEQI